MESRQDEPTDRMFPGLDEVVDAEVVDWFLLRKQFTGMACHLLSLLAGSTHGGQAAPAEAEDLPQAVQACLALQHLARSALSSGQVFWIAPSVPAAATLDVFGEFGEDSYFIVQPQKTRDDAGALIAGVGAGRLPRGVLEDFKALTDEIDPLLDWLGELSGHGYMGAHTIDLVAPGSYGARNKYEFMQSDLENPSDPAPPPLTAGERLLVYSK